MKKITKILIATFLGIIISANLVLANGDTGQRDLSINLSNFLGFTVVSGLPQYVSRIYNIMITIGGSLASFMIIVAGFQYVTARGNKSKVDVAVKRIENSVIALFLIFGAYFILNTINPALTRLEMPKIAGIKSDKLTFSNYKQMGIESGTFNCDTQSTNDQPIPLGENAETWCTNHCNEFYTAHEVIRGNAVEGQEARICCHCSSPRADVTPPTRTPGAPVDCVVSAFTEGVPEDQRRSACSSFSGSDGVCRLITLYEEDGLPSVVLSAHCEWIPTSCSSDADCTRAGSVHCWGGSCFQQKQENGGLCPNGNNTACLSNSCVSTGWFSRISFCAPLESVVTICSSNPRAPECTNLTNMDGMCLNDNQCQSGLCRTHPSTPRDTLQCN